MEEELQGPVPLTRCCPHALGLSAWQMQRIIEDYVYSSCQHLGEKTAGKSQPLLIHISIVPLTIQLDIFLFKKHKVPF